MTSDDVDYVAAVAGAEGVIEKMHAALEAFVVGNPQPAVDLFSRAEDVTLGNPFGPFVRGWDAVADAATRAATHYRDGKIVGFERVATYSSADLACFVEVERYRAKIGGQNEMSPVALRVSTVVRREADGWWIASRHADPITASRTAESVIGGR